MEVTLEPTQMSFMVNDAVGPFKLAVQYNEEEWPQVCFCVNLCSKGDAVEIVD